MIHPIMKRKLLSPDARLAGFTTTELLCVIAIIGILVAILIPVIGKTRDNARSGACLSNLRQISIAHQLYAAENRQRLVPIATGSSGSNAVTWRAYLKPYLGDSPDLAVLRCPADVSTAVYRSDDPQAFKMVIPASYGVNNSSMLHDYLADTTPPQHRNKRIPDIRNLSRLIFVADIGNVANASATPDRWTQTVTSAGNYGYATFPDQGSWAGGNNWNAFPRHNGRINAAFYDGSAASLHVVNDIVAHPPSDPRCYYRN